MAPINGECVQNRDISFEMERLFDHYNFDHISPDKRLSLFKQRDLAHVKHYKMAVKMFGGPSKRTRMHIAPPMETPFKNRLGMYQNDCESPQALSVDKLEHPPLRLYAEETVAGKKDEEKEYVSQYNNLIAERKQLRSDLDNLLPDEAYLARKINKSEMEMRVQAQYRAHRVQKCEVTSVPVKNLPTPKLHPGIPDITLPPSNGIQILEMFLSQNHMRLMDLFHKADKNKNWVLTRQEFVNAVTQSDIPLTEAEVDAMFVMLDADLDGKLSYQELKKGLLLWHKQKRCTESQKDEKAKKHAGIKNTSEGNKIRPTSSGVQTTSKSGLKAQCQKETPVNEARPGSPRSSSQSHTSTPSSLTPPPPDLRQEARVPSSMEEGVDIRKHDRFVLSQNKIWRQLKPDKQIVFDKQPGVIKVGYKPIDDHCLESTMGGQSADGICQFRQAKLKEYFSIKKLFEQRGLPFTQKVLDRVILHPGDQPISELKQTAGSHAEHFTDQKHPFTKIKSVRGNSSYRNLGSQDAKSRFAGGKHTNLKGNTANASNGTDEDLPLSNTVEYGQEQMLIKNGQGYLTVQDGYPSSSSVISRPHKEKHSSGKALHSHEGNNVINLEKCGRLTQHLPNRLHHNHNRGKPQTEWPSNPSNKLRLYVDRALPPTSGHRRPLKSRTSSDRSCYGTGIYSDRGNALFQHVSQPKRAYPGYNNDLLTWPVGENGVIYGNVDEHRLVK